MQIMRQTSATQPLLVVNHELFELRAVPKLKMYFQKLKEIILE